MNEALAVQDTAPTKSKTAPIDSNAKSVFQTIEAVVAGSLIVPDFTAASDEEIMCYRELILRGKTEVAAIFEECTSAAMRELEARMIERRKEHPTADRIPSVRFEAVYEPVYGDYVKNIERLKDVIPFLPEEERVKVIRHIPEETTIIPEHWEMGNTNSITALMKHYAGTDVGDILAEAVNKPQTGHRLVVKMRPGAKLA